MYDVSGKRMGQQVRAGRFGLFAQYTRVNRRIKLGAQDNPASPMVKEAIILEIALFHRSLFLERFKQRSPLARVGPGFAAQGPAEGKS